MHHYRMVINTHTTMVWAALSTLCTLLMWGVRYVVHPPTWGGIHTLTTVGMGMSLTCTLAWVCAHLYVRATHKQVVLSTRYPHIWA